MQQIHMLTRLGRNIADCRSRVNRINATYKSSMWKFGNLNKVGQIKPILIDLSSREFAVYFFLISHMTTLLIVKLADRTLFLPVMAYHGAL